MRNLNYRVMSFVMSIIMLLGGFIIPVQASGNGPVISLEETNKVIETDDIYLYAEDYQDYIIATTIHKETGRIFVSLKYYEDNDISYEWEMHINDFKVVKSEENNDIWAFIIDEALSNFENSTKIFIPDLIMVKEVDESKNDEDEIGPLSSANADMRQDLLRIHGTEYSGKTLYTNNVIIPNNVLRIKEDMDYRFSKYTTITTRSMSVATFTTSVLGLKTTWLGAVSLLLGIVGDMVESGKRIQEYVCKVMYFRYSNVGNSPYEYTLVTKTIEYRGFENTTGYGRAFVATDTGSTYYSNENLFNSHSAHAREAKIEYDYYGPVY